MESNSNSKEISLTNLLLKLYNDEMTGVVSLKDNRRAIKIYLQRGHVVYADGIDKDRQLLKEIVAKRKLDHKQFNELENIKEKDPQSLGKILMERKLISQSVWGRFLELKVKHILMAAFKMEPVDLGFSKSELNVLPINFIDLNIIQLLLDTLRGIEEPEHLTTSFPGEDAVFDLSKEAEPLKATIPLSPSEQRIFSMIDGQKKVQEIITDSGLDQKSVFKILYLLLSFELIAIVPQDGGKKESAVDYGEIINLYLDLLGIVETNFQKEIGKEFENIFSKCRDELTGPSKELLHDLSLSKDSQEGIVKEISGRFAPQSNAAEGRLILLSSFNKLVYLLIMRMKKVLGTGLTAKTLEEMMNILDYVEKYRQDKDMMNYVMGNLKDYLEQVRS